MMMFAKFFWEIFLGQILDPFFKNFFLGNFWFQNTTTPFSKKIFPEFFCPIFLKYLYYTKNMLYEYKHTQYT